MVKKNNIDHFANGKILRKQKLYVEDYLSCEKFILSYNKSNKHFVNGSANLSDHHLSANDKITFIQYQR